MKLLVDKTGLNGKPINNFKEWEWFDFDNRYPARPLTTPQQPNSIIEVEDETVWQTRNDENGSWFNCTNNKPLFLNEYPWLYRQLYKPKEQPKDASNYFVCTNIPGKEQEDINVSLLALWSNIETWYGDPKKLESGRQLLLRLQSLYDVKLKGNDTGCLVNSYEKIAQSSNIESVEQAAEKFASEYYDQHERLGGFCQEWLDGLECGAENGYKVGFGEGQKHQSNKEVVELIQGRLDLCYANYHSQDAIDILTDLLTQIKR